MIVVATSSEEKTLVLPLTLLLLVVAVSMGTMPVLSTVLVLFVLWTVMVMVGSAATFPACQEITYHQLLCPAHHY